MDAINDIDSRIINIDIPKVSIVVPSLNVAPYIKECMESIINQTLKDIEVICVDANSNDGTLEILKEYEQNDARIKVIVSDKRSYGYQMNLGIKEAKGEYLGIVEPDDFIKENMYKTLYNLAKDEDVEMIRENAIYFYEKNNKYEMSNVNVVWNGLAYGKINNINTDIRVLTKVLVGMNALGIYKLSFIKENDIKFNETPGASYQDNGFWFQMNMLAKSIYFHNDAHYYYRRDNPNSSCNNKEKIYDICKEYDFIVDMLEKYNTKDLAPIVAYLRFNMYIWNLNRIDISLVADFAKRFFNDFVDLNNKKLLDIKLFQDDGLRYLSLLLQADTLQEVVYLAIYFRFQQKYYYIENGGGGYRTYFSSYV
ncbi:glycosyltransferase family 2 protein [Helicobacter didelphidarum]|uniref:glycosyltransferase family 2 protein n=1 Tax=Helicobacter didelphidarum TaxID=2040648 RepID=UPI0038B3F4DF